MSDNIPFSSQPKKAFHQRNASDELDVFEAARYFSGASENFTGSHKSISGESMNSNFTTQKHCMRPFGRMSLDMPKGNPNIPLQAMLLENNPIMINKEIKKSKQLPSSPGGKLAHFLNSLFNQTSSKKSKSKTKSTKDEDESPNGWRRKRRSSMSHFRSSNTATTTTMMHDASKSLFSTSSSSGYRTPPTYQVANTPTKTTSYRDHFKSYSYLKPPPSQITKAPINGNFNNANHKCDFISEKTTTFGNGSVEKVKMFDEKQEDHYQPHSKYILNKDIQEFKRFIDEDDGGDSDSSSDLFELTNCDMGYCSSGLPVYETTHMDTIKRGAPISS